MAYKSQSRCWLIDLASPLKGMLSRFGKVAVDTLESFFPNRDAIGTVAARLSNPGNPSEGLIFDDQETCDRLNTCLRELLTKKDSDCEILLILCPNEIAGYLEEAFSTEVYKTIQAAFLSISKSENPETLFDFLQFMHAPKTHKENLTRTFFRFIALAEWVGRSGKAIIVVPDRPSQHRKLLEKWNFSIESYSSLEVPKEPDRYDRIRQYLLTVLGNDLLGFHPHFRDAKGPTTLSEDLRVSEAWVKRSIQPYEEYYYDWYRQEFGSRKVGKLFTDACWESICSDKIKQRTNRKLLPVAIQYAIGVARLCRRMATWTLEGTPFACTIVLLSTEAMRSLGSTSSRFSRLIDLRPPTPFNMRNEDVIRRHAELAQSEGLYLIVSANDGLLHSIGTTSGGPNRGMRHSFHGWLAGNGSLIFDIRPGGKIHLYGRNGLLLDHDGFHWTPSPLAWVTRQFTDFFSARHRSDDAPSGDVSLKRPSDEHGARCSQTLSDATRRLVDNHESSIFALLDETDNDSAKGMASEMLRPDMRWSSSDQVSIDRLDSESLAGLLHLDGAHLISRDGHVLSISRRINARPYRDEVLIEDPEQIANITEYLKNNEASGETSFTLVKFTDQSKTQTYLRLYGRLRPSQFEKWNKDENNSWIGLELKKALQDILDRDTPLHVVVSVHNFPEATVVTLKEKLQVDLSTTVIEYNSINLIEAYADKNNPNQNESINCLLLPDIYGDHDARKQLDEIIDTFGFKEHLYEIQLHKEVFPFDTKRLEQETRWPDGVTYDQEKSAVYVEECVVDKRMDGKKLPTDLFEDGDVLLDVVRQQLLAWRSLGGTAAAQAPGTGARAAIELSRQLSSSLVVKVSASGGFKLFRAGRPLS